MQAIEFVSQEKQGKIEIPQEYLERVTGQFRVILLLEGPTEPLKSKKKKTFKALKIKTKGFKFNRDDAYDD